MGGGGKSGKGREKCPAIFDFFLGFFQESVQKGLDKCRCIWYTSSITVNRKE